MERLIFFDTETTGLKVEDGHRVVELGAVEALDRQLTANYFQTYLNPERASDEDAFRIHQLTDDFLAKQPKFSEKAEEFLTFINGATLVIHNADFDMGFINAELARLKLPKINNPIVDTTKLARGAVQGLGNVKLDTLCDYFKVDRSHRTKHGALLDAELLAEVYLRMTRKQEGLDMQSFDHLGYAKKIKPFTDTTGARTLISLTLSAESKVAHENMLKTFKAPHFWQDDGSLEKTAVVISS